jgi:hypothetical protein
MIFISYVVDPVTDSETGSGFRKFNTGMATGKELGCSQWRADSLTFRRPATRPEKKIIAFFFLKKEKMFNCELFATFGYKKNCVCIRLRMHNTGFECSSCIFIDVFL